ncbi:MAG: MmcQ/YjbR family DNA-binding protein [Chlorobi bacterium]|nr:MmcQ/YjbR family DNA-binding protein [Chlorobiota bacterium]
MFVENIRTHCLAKKGTTESFPFDDETLVFKVMNKMFCLLNIIPPVSLNVKCDPENAIELRERHEGVEPGFHMNKKHWNTIKPELITDVKLIYDWIDDSYDLVVKGLTKKAKDELNK